jgi:hypothetical protein
LFFATWLSEKRSADSWMFVLFLGPHLMLGSGGLGRNHSRLVVVAPKRRLAFVSGPYDCTS